VTPNPLDIAIIGGLGHVGLPLGAILADSGYTVGLYDLSIEKRSLVRAGKMPFIEHGADDLLPRLIADGSLQVVDTLEEAARARIIVVTIGTPLDEYQNPRLDPVFRLARELKGHLMPGQHVMLRSTVFPGTTRQLAKFLSDTGAEVSFCPERIVQGHAIRELRELPQIVSGAGPGSAETAAAVFHRMGVTTITCLVEEAELAKLYLNAWRYIQFAAANQFYQIATDRGLDYSKIYEAMTSGYERGKALPKPGFAAGPCLLKDTMQLAAATPNGFQLGRAAALVNEGLPEFILRKLQRLGGALDHATVGILGMAFKADIDDTRDSLSFKLKKLLEFAGCRVLCSDEYATGEGWVTKEELLEKSNVVIVGTPHAAYAGLKVPSGTHGVDIWGCLS
jgi:UDP-N-acetyl-D-mannosaminuronic acid dehydrogenase